jgi:hypothetical protein
MNLPPVRRGPDHPRARFNWTEVEEIRKAVEEDGQTYRAAARDRGCARSTIFKLVNRITYRP